MNIVPIRTSGNKLPLSAAEPQHIFDMLDKPQGVKPLVVIALSPGTIFLNGAGSRSLDNKKCFLAERKKDTCVFPHSTRMKLCAEIVPDASAIQERS